MITNSTQYIARQAIFDSEQSIFSYELLYRDSENNYFPSDVSDAQATGRMFFNSLLLIGVEKLSAGQKAFINLSDESLLHEIPNLLNPTNLVIEIVERTKNIDKLQNTVKKMSNLSYEFALDDYDGSPKWEPLMKYISYIKLEMEKPIKQTIDMINKLHRYHPNVKIIVERIESLEEFNAVKSAGANYFQGFFFARPEMLNHSNIGPSKLIVFDLLRCTTEKNICFDEVQARISKDLSLATRVLKLANGKADIKSSNIKFESIYQAIEYLGEETIRQFVSVLALSELGENRPQELTKLGLTRANFLSLFLEPIGKEASEQGYLIGLISILNAVLKKDLDSVVSDFSISEDMINALLNYQGVLGGALKLAVEIEQNKWARAEKILHIIRPQAQIEEIYDLAMKSRFYADEICDAVKQS
jgi:c-di-GMP phosphodiesterase